MATWITGLKVSKKGEEFIGDYKDEYYRWLKKHAVVGVMPIANTHFTDEEIEYPNFDADHELFEQYMKEVFFYLLTTKTWGIRPGQTFDITWTYALLELNYLTTARIRVE
jgi:hypothetical protein